MTQFEEYAKLLVEVGVNIQKGQNLVISCPVDCAWFARLCARAAYDAGCREVTMRWLDDELNREKFLRAADDVFDSVPAWAADMLTSSAKGGAAFLHIAATDPENLKGVDPDRLLRQRRASGKALEEYRRLQMTNAVAWSIGAVPIPSWAQKVFPGRVEEESMEKLWDAIFAAVRVTGDGKAVERWRAHTAAVQERVEKLNALNLESLHYANSLGTDLTVRLPEGHLWAGGPAGPRAAYPLSPTCPPRRSSPLPCGPGWTAWSTRPCPCRRTGIWWTSSTWS